MEIQCIGKNAIDAVYEANVEKVYRVALYFSENHYTAQDIVQTVFMKLYTNMDNINMNNVEAWLKTTAKHMAINERKKNQKVSGQEELVWDVDDTMENVVYLESLEDRFINKMNIKIRADFAEKIYADLYQKNERWYEAITITYILQKPQKEVAETMGISLSTLQMMLYRAKNWIRKRYEKQFDYLDEA